MAAVAKRPSMVGKENKFKTRFSATKWGRL